MTILNSIRTLASVLTLFLVLSTAILAYALTENGYNFNTSLLTDASETTHAESGYKAIIFMNPNVFGVLAQENGYKLNLAITTSAMGGSLKENGFKLELVPEKSFPDFGELALRKINTSKDGCLPKPVVCQNFTVRINVTVANQGAFAESITIVVHANSTAIGTRTLGYLASNAQTTLTFIWNTTGYAKGAYTISAYALPNLDEANLTDNTIQNGILTVVMVGDVNADGKDDLKDVFAVGKAFGTTRQGPNPSGRTYSPNCDINDDDKIDLKDYYTTCKNYGKEDP
jgi:hypothetical protein